MATTFTDELLQNGLTKQILKLLCDIQVETEMEKLGKQRGLGDAKHRMQVCFPQFLLLLPVMRLTARFLVNLSIRAVVFYSANHICC